jgi:hypothetical protein
VNTLTLQDLSKAEMWLLITTLIYFLMNGAQIFETAAIVPKWSASPPDSFALISGTYGIDLKTFWIIFHSIHEVTFFIALYFCWKIDPVRSWLLILLGIHVAVRVWTLVYFAPNIIQFQKMAADRSVAYNDLTAKVALWRSLNYIRVAIFIGVSIGLVPLLYKVINLKASLAN